MFPTIDALEAQPAIDAAWLHEIECRATAMERGEAKWLDGPETLAAIKAEFE